LIFPKISKKFYPFLFLIFKAKTEIMGINDEKTPNTKIKKIMERLLTDQLVNQFSWADVKNPFGASDNKASFNSMNGVIALVTDIARARRNGKKCEISHQ
jgi:hypothetical protein